MGESKARMFLPRVVAAAAPLFDELIAVARVAGEPLPIRTIVEEPHEAESPIFGIRAALQDAGAPCFILAVDYPLITTELLRELRDRGGVPTWDGRPQPLCARWEPSLLPLLERRVGEGKIDVLGLIAEAKVEIIPESLLRARHAGEPLMNVNTPEELRKAEKLNGR